MSANRLTPGLALYRAATAAFAPFAPLLLEQRRRRGKEDPARLAERLGRTGATRPEGPLLWIHAASVGESLSVLPLLGEILAAQPRLSAVVTTGTVTSAALLSERLPARARHQFAPVDTPGAVRRFLDAWRPDLAFWVESELWPNLLLETARRRIPMALVNARLSETSFRGWLRAGGAARRLLSAFALCLAQDEATAERLRRLGARRVEAPGNLKSAAQPLHADPAALAELSAQIGARPRWCAASIHPGEETAAGEVHAALRGAHRGLLTILVPRHPERGPGFAERLGALGLKAALRSRGEAIAPETEIFVADTLGELGLFYRVAPVAFVGGSLIPHGGQNPMEPARLGCAVLHGPHMFNFAEFAAQLDASGAVCAADAPALAAEVGRLLGDPAETARRGAALKVFAERQTGALARTLEALAPLVEQADARA